MKIKLVVDNIVLSTVLDFGKNPEFCDGFYKEQ